MTANLSALSGATYTSILSPAHLPAVNIITPL